MVGRTRKCEGGKTGASVWPLDTDQKLIPKVTFRRSSHQTDSMRSVLTLCCVPRRGHMGTISIWKKQDLLANRNASNFVELMSCSPHSIVVLYSPPTIAM